MNETLPAELGVMVLPGAVLFPHTLLPLHIFEPRYRRMLEHALEVERVFAIGCRRPGTANDEPFAIGGAGVVRACVRNADGTSNLVLQGLQRVKFVSWSQLEPYRIARIEPLISRNSAATATGQLTAIVQEIRAALAREGLELPAGFANTIGQMVDTDALSDAVAAALIEDPERRRKIFEELDVPARLLGLVRCLRAQLEGGDGTEIQGRP